MKIARLFLFVTARALLFVAAIPALFAQVRSGTAGPHLVTIASTNGQIELRLFITTAAEEYSQPRAAYQVSFHGKLLMDTSFFGIETDGQPMLGENVGMVSAERKSVDETYTLVAGKAKTV